MASTVIPTGHALARKVFGAAVFAEMTRQPTFMNRLTGEAPDMGEVRSKLEKMETPRGYPVVRIMDLARSAGDTVSVDLFNILQGRPATGDTLIAGRMMSITSNSQDIKLNQLRGGVNTGRAFYCPAFA